MHNAKRILVVEDDFLIGEKLCGILESAGHTIVDVTASGKDAVTLTAALQPDLITMDWRLLDLDGVTAARQIMAQCPTPIILITAYETPDLIAEASAAGISYYLVKPVTRGTVTRAISIALARFDDLQELRRLNAALQDEIATRQRYAAELERSNRDLEQFAYIVSHDLRAPLRMIKGFLGLLQRQYQGQLDDKADEYINFAVEGAENMGTLIEALLGYARVDSQGQDPVPTDANATLDATLRTLQFRIEAADATVTYDPLPTVLVDPTQLGQLFQNLIANALKFHRPDVPPHITVAAERAEDAANPAWIFSVQDNGIGIPQDQQARIFGIFQRLHTCKEYEGTGIGLAVCKKIVERHGGRIWVESEVGEGTTFYFTLPAVPSQA